MVSSLSTSYKEHMSRHEFPLFSTTPHFSLTKCTLFHNKTENTYRLMDKKWEIIYRNFFITNTCKITEICEFTYTNELTDTCEFTETWEVTEKYEVTETCEINCR